MGQLDLFDLTGKVAVVTGASMGFGVMFAHITGQTLFVDGGHEACRGAWQMTPSHHFWNKDQPKLGAPYEGLVPNEFESWKQGIPGIHYPMPEG